MISLKGELYRKAIHLASSLIPIIYFFVDRKFALTILIPITVLMITVEILKYRSKFVRDTYFRIFGFILRSHETNTKTFRINGASWLLFGDVLVIIFFPKLIAIHGMLMLSVADSMSAIVGRLYGKKKYAPNRTYAGTIAFFISGIILIFILPKYIFSVNEYMMYVVMVIITTIADSVNLPWDDNFTIPVVSCTVIFIFYLIFYSQLNLNLF